MGVCVVTACSTKVFKLSLNWFTLTVPINITLYKLWDRLSSGSYHSSAVLRVDIPKADGGVRSLGIPTMKDRIA